MTDNMRDSGTDNKGRDQTKHNRTTDIDVKTHDPNRSQSFNQQANTGVMNKGQPRADKAPRGADFGKTGEANTGFKGEAGPEYKGTNADYTGKGETGRQGGSAQRPNRPGHRDLTPETHTPSRENYTSGIQGMRDNPGSEYGSTKGKSFGDPSFKGSTAGFGNQSATQMEQPRDENDAHYGSQGYKVAGAKSDKATGKKPDKQLAKPEADDAKDEI